MSLYYYIYFFPHTKLLIIVFMALKGRHKQEKNNWYSLWSQLIDERTQVIFLACWLSICKQFSGVVTFPFTKTCYGFVFSRKIMRTIYQEKVNNKAYTFQLICFHLFAYVHNVNYLSYYMHVKCICEKSKSINPFAK